MVSDKSLSPGSEDTHDNIYTERTYMLKLPQILLGGMSENWMLKELGAVHWSMIEQALNTPETEFRDADGHRLYASFVRVSWRSDHSLFAFKEDEPISIRGNLSRFGAKMLLSHHEIHGTDKKIRSSMMTVFSQKTSDNNQDLKDSTGLSEALAKVQTTERIPDFAKYYRPGNGSVLKRNNLRGIKKAPRS